MNNLIQLEKVTNYTNGLCVSLKSLVELEQNSRVKEIVFGIFSRLASFFDFFNSHTKEVNLLPVAMIGCVSLVGILAISIFWRSEKSPVIPPSPKK